MYIKMLEGDADARQEFLLDHGAVIALGSFDGLHKGHMALIRQAVASAKQDDRLKSCVFTFSHSGTLSPCISSDTQRIGLLRSAGVDLLVMREFTEQFKHISPQMFFEQYLVKKLRAKVIVVGFNYRFGYMGGGDAAFLQMLCHQAGIALFVIPPVLYEGEPVSSTRIRQAVADGALSSAREMLGRDFSVTGAVSRGDGIGRTLGFPTANLAVEAGHLMPPTGVYATKTVVDGRAYPSLTNYGAKPTIKKGMDLIETHILNFDGQIYGKTIEVFFERKIRDIKTFPSKEALMRRLDADRQEILDKP